MAKAIDVFKTHEDQLLELLGNADWVIALPDGLPDFTITTQWRRTLQEYIAKRFVRWVMEGIDRVLTHDYDPPWDCSGSLQNVKTDPLMLLVRHESLSGWAENEYTGNNSATYMSGMGLMWITYAEDIEDDIERQLISHFAAHCMDFWKIEDEKNLIEDERWEDSDIFFVAPRLASVLLEDALQLSTADAWKQFENDIRAENEAKRISAEQYRYKQKQVSQLWEFHFPDLMDLRIEMSLFQELDLEERITEVLADADPAIVRMMAEVSIPGNYSNSVRECIKDIVRRANM